MKIFTHAICTGCLYVHPWGEYRWETDGTVETDGAEGCFKCGCTDLRQLPDKQPTPKTVEAALLQPYYGQEMPKWLTTRETASLLGITPTTVGILHRNGKVKRIHQSYWPDNRTPLYTMESVLHYRATRRARKMV